MSIEERRAAKAKAKEQQAQDPEQRPPLDLRAAVHTAAVEAMTEIGAKPIPPLDLAAVREAIHEVVAAELEEANRVETNQTEQIKAALQRIYTELAEIRAQLATLASPLWQTPLYQDEGRQEEDGQPEAEEEGAQEKRGFVAVQHQEVSPTRAVGQQLHRQDQSEPQPIMFAVQRSGTNRQGREVKQ